MTDLIETAATSLTDQLPPRGKRSNKIKTSKKILTDRTIKKLLKDKTLWAAPGQRYTIWDAELPGFGVRVTDKHLSCFCRKISRIAALVPPYNRSR